MPDDTYTEVTQQSWFSRLGNAFKGVLFGLVLFIAAFPLLFWNEGRAVKAYKTLKEGEKSVISVTAESVTATNEGRLVHVQGLAVTPATLSDSQWSITAPHALQLFRKVEMYQWKENKEQHTEKQLGGGTTTTTTYHYDKVWSEQRIDSSRFHAAGEHANPSSMSCPSQRWLADPVTVGAFRLSSTLVSRIPCNELLALGTNVASSAWIGKNGHPMPDGVYVGNDASTPQIGDLRIQFFVAPQANVSVVARQTGNQLSTYAASTGRSIELLDMGLVPPALMFQEAETQAKVLTWILRAVGFLIMFLGVFLVLNPLSVLGDVLPILGDILEVGVGLIAFAVATPLSLLTIAMAWLFYRPWLTAILLILAGGVCVLVRNRLQKKKEAAKAGACAAS